MKFSIVLILTVLVSVLSAQKLNQFRTPPPSGICKQARFKANGTQIRSGFCSSQIQGQIPDTDHMTSTLILFPKNGGTVRANKNFTAIVAIQNLKTGAFSDAANDYYDQPQKLAGKVISGHSHITIQDLGNANKPLDARVFAFFKGLNFAAVGGKLSQVVGTEKAPGLPEGDYRMCTMASSFTHQPVIMPVAQRGSQDDCIRFSAVKGRH